MQSQVLETPVGPVELACSGGVLRRLEIGLQQLPAEGAERTVPTQLLQALRDYFSGNIAALNVPDLLLQPQGTPFQQRVWAALRRIPAGESRTYGQLARELGTSARAIGGACRANPIPLFIPCHRVVAASGLGGFSGAREGRWLEIKSQLLQHEARCRRLPN